MKENEIPSGLNRIGQLGLGAGVLGIVGLLAGFGMAGKAQFFQSYIFAFVFWVGMSLGCFAFTILHHATTSKWALPVIRLFEAGNKTLPIMAIAFLPLLAGLSDLYPWANPKYAHFAVTIHRHGWMNPGFWTARAVIFFAFWIGMSTKLNKMAKQQDETGDLSLIQKRSCWAAPSLVFHVLFITFAITDWVMSLHPSWFSTIYGVLFMVGQCLAAMSLITMIVTFSAKTDAYKDIVTPKLTRDLGNFLLTFTMLWAYMSLSQFLIIWSGNQPDEIEYFVTRNTGPLLIIGTLVLVGQFFGPFVVLLSGKTKRRPHILAKVALWIFIIRILDVFWVVKPMFQHEGLPLHWMDIAAFIGLGGLWMFFFVNNVKQNTLFPLKDPRLQEAMNHA